MGKSKNKPHVLSVYLTQDEYDFLKICSAKIGKTMAQTLLYLADFKTRRLEYTVPEEPEEIIDFLGIPVEEDTDEEIRISY